MRHECELPQLVTIQSQLQQIAERPNVVEMLVGYPTLSGLIGYVCGIFQVRSDWQSDLLKMLEGRCPRKFDCLPWWERLILSHADSGNSCEDYLDLCLKDESKGIQVLASELSAFFKCLHDAAQRRAGDVAEGVE